MSAKPRDLGMTPLDDLFSTDESRAEAQLEKVVTLNPADISDFPNHPFKVKQDEAMAEILSQSRPERKKPEQKSEILRIRLIGNLKTARKLTGFRALYVHYCYLLGIDNQNE